MSEINRDQPPGTPDALHEFLRAVLDVEVAREPLFTGSSAPFAYLCHAFFEGARITGPAAPPVTDGPRAPADCVVWASRGSGKTFLGAVATTLDLVFKAGCQVRILAGSVEQAARMHEHLRRFFEAPALKPMLDGRPTARRLALAGGSAVEVLAPSQASVRGTRIQKLRCDELDLFNPEIWQAAQFTTRSLPAEGPWGRRVRGAVEALSTMHRPHGLMHRVAADAGAISAECFAAGPSRPRRALFRWNVIDSLEHCGHERSCAGCGLEEDCAGRARPEQRAVAGHLTIDDALQQKERAGRSAWESEMLCLRPMRDAGVLPEFDPQRHIYDWPISGPEDGGAEPDPDGTGTRGDGYWVAGMDFGYRNPSVVLWGHVDAEGTLRIAHEHLASGMTTAQHASALRDSARPRVKWVAIDPAGLSVNDQTGVSNAQVLRKAGVPVRAMRGRVHAGVMAVRARLAPAGNAERPRLYVHRSCTHLIEAMTTYHYPDDQPESLEPVKDGPDHACDALRYLVMQLDSRDAAGRFRYA